MRYPIIAGTLLCLGLLGGCANLAPDYQRPERPVPASFDAQSAIAPLSEKLDWQHVIRDERLAGTIQLALDNNRDLRIAVLNITKARAEYQIENAALYPAINGSLSGSSSSSAGTVTRKYTAGLGISAFELDLFGRLGNLRDVALESYLSSEATQRSVRTSLIAETANAWLTLGANQALLKLAQETMESRSKSLNVIVRQQALGGTSRLTVAQAQASLEAARRDVASYVSQVKQARNALDLLAGTSVPDTLLPVADTALDEERVTLLDVPAGLSSEVLLQRPDIIAAEHALKGANANIGAARAAFFPAITLTTSGGASSASLSTLFDAGTRMWTFAPSLTLPIFNAGKLSAALSSAKTERDIQVATYEKTVQTAFSEVADALAERSTMSQRIAAQQAETEAYATSLRLSTERYRSGADSYLTVLDSQRALYSAQQSLISLRLSEQSNRISLFKTLGGE